jgi:hypothetical protein
MRIQHIAGYQTRLWVSQGKPRIKRKNKQCIRFGAQEKSIENLR